MELIRTRGTSFLRARGPFMSQRGVLGEPRAPVHSRPDRVPPQEQRSSCPGFIGTPPIGCSQHCHAAPACPQHRSVQGVPSYGQSHPGSRKADGFGEGPGSKISRFPNHSHETPHRASEIRNPILRVGRACPNPILTPDLILNNPKSADPKRTEIFSSV